MLQLHKGYGDSLRSMQIAAVRSMLMLNEPQTNEAPRDSNDDDANEQNLWKVLVFDKLGKDIISPIMLGPDLRENGITLFKHIAEDRSPIEAPVIYFLEPTIDNIQQICADLRRNLYDSYYINFCSTVPQPVLMELVEKTVADNTDVKIKQVFDQYLNFVCTDPHLFSLNMPDTFVVLNNQRAADDDIKEAMDKITSALFSVMVTMDIVPIIRYPRGHAAEQVAQRLSNKLLDYVTESSKSNPGLASKISSDIHRPVLILLDRNLDLTPMLSHSWTYQALVHDLLSLKSNKITMKNATDGKSVTYYIDEDDFFWKKHKSSPFPRAAEAVDEELEKYKSDTASLKRRMGVSELEDIGQLSTNDANKKALEGALEALPELTARKATLDKHSRVGTALLNEIKVRQSDTFFGIENMRITKPDLMDAIRDTEKKPEDKMRLFLIYYLSTADILDHDIVEYEKALKEADCDLSPLQYIKKDKSLKNMKSILKAQKAPPQTSQGWNNFNPLNRFADTLKEGVLSGVKNFLATDKELLIRRIVSDIMSPPPNPSSETDGYLYLDPLPKKHQKKVSNREFEEAVVFVIGGGNYVEYQNLQEFTTTDGRQRKITYGSTEILSPPEFLKQLSQLGEEPS